MCLCRALAANWWHVRVKGKTLLLLHHIPIRVGGNLLTEVTIYVEFNSGLCDGWNFLRMNDFHTSRKNIFNCYTDIKFETSLNIYVLQSYDQFNAIAVNLFRHFCFYVRSEPSWFIPPGSSIVCNLWSWPAIKINFNKWKTTRRSHFGHFYVCKFDSY